MFVLFGKRDDMSGSRITVGDVEISHLYDLVADFGLTLSQAFPTVPAAAWERSAAMATTHRPGPDTQATPAQRPQAPTARGWPDHTVAPTTDFRYRVELSLKEAAHVVR
jgi:hypothetical protein